MKSLLVFALTVTALASSAVIRRDGFADTLYLTQGQQFPFVGRIHSGPGGILINDEWMLTAGHLYTGNITGSIKLGGITYVANGFVRDPLYNGGDIPLGYDFTLAKLTTRCLNVAPVKVFAGNPVGMLGYVVGLGLTGTGSVGATTGSQGVVRAGTNIIEDFVDYPNDVWTDFDDGTAVNNALPGSTSTVTALEGQIASGDSGGGIFVVGPSGKYELVGVNSVSGRFSGSNPDLYGGISGFAKVSLRLSWINSTIEAGSAGKVSGFVNLQGLVGSPQGMNTEIVIRDISTNNVLDTRTVPLAIDGSYSFVSPLRGNYKIGFKTPTGLRQSLASVPITSGWTQNQNVTLTNGDVVNDNVVDLSDYTAVAIAFNATVGNPNWNASADLNRDGIVDLSDYTIVVSNFNAIGAP
ncbi:MAG: trypsin-like serine protease [Armatimonadetes bacterium]|nr:trypsin-like serine protease [Armatimonadota bacterium]